MRRQIAEAKRQLGASSGVGVGAGANPSVAAAAAADSTSADGGSWLTYCQGEEGALYVRGRLHCERSAIVFEPATGEVGNGPRHYRVALSSVVYSRTVEAAPDVRGVRLPHRRAHRLQHCPRPARLI